MGAGGSPAVVRNGRSMMREADRNRDRCFALRPHLSIETERASGHRNVVAAEFKENGERDG
jgi:hypothetical protein